MTQTAVPARICGRHLTGVVGHLSRLVLRVSPTEADPIQRPGGQIPGRSSRSHVRPTGRTRRGRRVCRSGQAGGHEVLNASMHQLHVSGSQLLKLPVVSLVPDVGPEGDGLADYLVVDLRLGELGVQG